MHITNNRRSHRWSCVLGENGINVYGTRATGKKESFGIFKLKKKKFSQKIFFSKRSEI